MKIGLCICWMFCALASDKYAHRPFDMCYYIFAKEDYKREDFKQYMEWLKKQGSTDLYNRYREELLKRTGVKFEDWDYTKSFWQEDDL